MKKDANLNEEKALIDSCIKKSKDILQMKATLASLRLCQVNVALCSKVFPSEKTLIELENEICSAIEENKTIISRFLKPILVNYKVLISDKFWFSSSEIERGYVLLRKQNEEYPSVVLMLKEFIDFFDNTRILPGEVRYYKDINHLLEKIDVSVEMKRKLKKSNGNGKSKN